MSPAHSTENNADIDDAVVAEEQEQEQDTVKVSKTKSEPARVGQELGKSTDSIAEIAKKLSEYKLTVSSHNTSTITNTNNAVTSSMNKNNSLNNYNNATSRSGSAAGDNEKFESAEDNVEKSEPTAATTTATEMKEKVEEKTEAEKEKESPITLEEIQRMRFDPNATNNKNNVAEAPAKVKVTSKTPSKTDSVKNIEEIVRAMEAAEAATPDPNRKPTFAEMLSGRKRNNLIVNDSPLKLNPNLRLQ